MVPVQVANRAEPAYRGVVAYREAAGRPKVEAEVHSPAAARLAADLVHCASPGDSSEEAVQAVVVPYLKHENMDFEHGLEQSLVSATEKNIFH